MYPNEWAGAVGELLARTETPQAALAKRLGVGRAIVNRFLTGERSPKPDMVEAINVAVGALFNSDDLQHYLDSLAAELGLIEKPDISFNEAHYALEALHEYCRLNQYFELMKEIRSIPEVKRRRLYRSVDTIWRKSLIRNIDGHPKRGLYDEMSNILSRFGIEASKFFCDLEFARARDEFYFTLRQSMIDEQIPFAQRNMIESKVVAAHKKVLDATETGLLGFGKNIADLRIANLKINFIKKLEEHYPTRSGKIFELLKAAEAKGFTV